MGEHYHPHRLVDKTNAKVIGPAEHEDHRGVTVGIWLWRHS